MNIERKVLVTFAAAAAGGLTCGIQSLQADGFELGSWVPLLLAVLGGIGGQRVSNANIAPSSVAAAKLEGKV